MQLSYKTKQLSNVASYKNPRCSPRFLFVFYEMENMGRVSLIKKCYIVSSILTFVSVNFLRTEGLDLSPSFTDSPAE